jgi:hypothetical protein
VLACKRLLPPHPLLCWNFHYPIFL